MVPFRNRRVLACVIPTAFAITAGVGLFVTSHAQFSVQPVLKVSGSPRAILPESTKEIGLTPGRRLPLGSRAISSADGEVFISLVPGIVMQLRENTEIETGSVKMRKGDGETEGCEAEIVLLAGTVTCSVEDRDDAQENVRVRTSSELWVAGGGTLFSLTQSGEDSTIVCGAGSVRSMGKKFVVGAATFAEWSAGKPFRTAVVSSDARAQAEVAQLLAASSFFAQLPPEELTLRALLSK